MQYQMLTCLKAFCYTLQLLLRHNLCWQSLIDFSPCLRLEFRKELVQLEQENASLKSHLISLTTEMEKLQEENSRFKSENKILMGNFRKGNKMETSRLNFPESDEKTDCIEKMNTEFCSQNHPAKQTSQRLKKKFLVKVFAEKSNDTARSESSDIQSLTNDSQLAAHEGVEIDKTLESADSDELVITNLKDYNAQVSKCNSESEQVINSTEIQGSDESNQLAVSPDSFEISKSGDHYLPPFSRVNGCKNFRDCNNFLSHVGGNCQLKVNSFGNDPSPTLTNDLKNCQMKEWWSEEDRQHLPGTTHKLDSSTQDQAEKSNSNSCTMVQPLCNKRCNDEKLFSCESCHVSFTNVDEFVKHTKTCILGISEDMAVHINLEHFRQQLLGLKKTHWFAIGKADLIRVCRKEKTLGHCKVKQRILKPKKFFPSIFLCRFCSKIFHRRSALQRHERSVHAQRKYSCQLCDKTFFTKQKKKDHENTVHLVVGKYRCNLCGNLYKDQAQVLKHERTVHSVNLNFQCHLCGTLFKDKLSLQRHEKRELGMVLRRTYLCHKCSKVLYTKDNLDRHLRTHNEVEKYKCPKCDLSFKTKGQLSDHENMHNKLSNCELCGRIFQYKRNLVRHKQIAHGETGKIQCSVCNLLFVSSFRLNFHKRMQHPE